MRNSENKVSKLKVTIIVIVALFLVIAILNCFQTIPTGFVGIKLRFGKAQDGIIQEGLHFNIPFVETIEKLDCRTKKVETYSEASTKDLQTVSASIAVNYNVNKDSANKLYREIGVDYENIVIAPAILESIKSSMAGYTAEELITKRSEISNQIRSMLTDKISDKGFTITEFNITNIDFSEEYDQAIEAKAVKQQEVVAAQAELEKQRIQNEKEVSIAEKDAKVMELQNSQITENTLKLKELEVQEEMIQKLNGVLPSTVVGEDFSGLLNVGK